MINQKTLFLGISLSHDASASLHAHDGKIIYALQEERISRTKNHYGIPVLAITNILQQLVNNPPQSLAIVIGSHNNLTLAEANRFLALLENNPSMKIGSFTDSARYIYPGFSSDGIDAKLKVELVIRNIIYGIFPNLTLFFEWENHHDSHLGCSLALTGDEPNLLVSLDGAGDGESGGLAVSSANSKMTNLIRFSDLDSLGLLYSAVTSRYNFRPMRHEGKITGLAAFGDDKEIVELFNQFIEVANGKINLGYQKSKNSFLTRIVRKISQNYDGRPNSIQDFVDEVAKICKKYPDLAFGVQEALELNVVEIISYWQSKMNLKHLSLSGGVFSNVKLNQRLSEMPGISKVKVFPNMGDGGISAGGVWNYLSKNGKLSHGKLFEDMYLAPPADPFTEMGLFKADYDLEIETLSEIEIPNLIASDIDRGQMVAVHWGRMEFGPRALGNRSLLLDPRNDSIKKTANERLKRTEFMPFAPICIKDYFHKYFFTRNESLQPFYYMTMTCDVRQEFRKLIPAVTHVDGTARPQIVDETSNSRMYRTIIEFGNLTGLYVLVNTSLNVHEEPINYTIKDSISALKRDAFDVLYYENWRIKKAKKMNIV